MPNTNTNKIQMKWLQEAHIPFPILQTLIIDILYPFWDPKVSLCCRTSEKIFKLNCDSCGIKASWQFSNNHVSLVDSIVIN